jgi:hypothetical protein
LATAGANTTVLVWQVPSLPRPGRVASLDEESAWRDLHQSDGVKAFRAILHLAATPEKAIRLVKARLKPRPAVSVKNIGKLIADLDSDHYAVREQAERDLAEIGPAANEALKAATKSKSLEVKRRAEDLLSKLASGGARPAPDRLAALRAVEVLEKIGTPAARELLKSLLDRTKKQLDPLEEAIKASLERLGEAS